MAAPECCEPHIEHLREEMNERLWDKGKYPGMDCWICDKHCYARPETLYPSTVMMLAAMYALGGQDGWVSLEQIRLSGKAGKLTRDDLTKNANRPKYFGLAQVSSSKKETGVRKGLQRILPNGVAFLKGHITVPKTIYTFNRLVLFNPNAEEQIDVHYALKRKFDLQKYLDGEL